jgi:hypothetical protein
MTFDDGPCRLAPSDGPSSLPLTVLLMETLERFGAKGTFDIVGDTSTSYPDRAGKEGTAFWGGLRYDHYPDIGRTRRAEHSIAPTLSPHALRRARPVEPRICAYLFGKKRFLTANGLIFRAAAPR